MIPKDINLTSQKLQKRIKNMLPSSKKKLSKKISDGIYNTPDGGIQIQETC